MITGRSLALTALAALAVCAPAARAATPDERAGQLLARMTLAEKISLLAGDDSVGVITGSPATGTSNGVPRVGIPTMYLSDGPVGPREGSATAMPSPLALAASFDPALARRVGAAIADEVKHKGNDLVHGPVADIMRTPLAGRTFETYGEDPFLATRFAVPWIEGAQAQGVIANLKHFALNSQEGQPPGVPPLASVVGFRGIIDARIDERTLREFYLPPFEAAVRDAHVGSVMCSYNRINGDPACQSHHLLRDILVRDWGFDGPVISDYAFAVKSTAPSLNNGLALEMPNGVFFTPALMQAALALGQVSEATIDARVRELLRMMFRFGMFDRPPFPADDNAIDKGAHAAVARDNEEQGAVLLRNVGVLPLDAAKLGSIAVIGKPATVLPNGGGSSAVKPFAFDSPLQALSRRAKASYADGSDLAAAAAAAHAADVAIVFAADSASEGVDKTCLSLDCPPSASGQDALISAVAAANPRTIVVLLTAGPVLTPWRDHVAAILEGWYPGEQVGEAIARVLFGDVDPSGRLPVTFPRAEGDAPTAGDREAYPGLLEAKYKEGVFVGYRHYDARGIEPAFPFGFGLSYTTFRVGGLQIAPARDGSLAATASVEIANTGARDASAVVQLYLGMPSPSAAIRQPPRQLKGFQKIRLAHGRSRRVTFGIDTRALSYWSVADGGWRVAPGCYRVMAGQSSRDISAEGVLAVGGAACPGPQAAIPFTAEPPCKPRRGHHRRAGCARKSG